MTNDHSALARRLLLIHMLVVSEERYASGWYADLERILWHEDSPEAQDLRDLAHICNGWWIWRDGKNEFITLEEWNLANAQES